MSAVTQQKSNNVATITRLNPSRMPIVKEIASEYNVTAADWRVLTEQIFPSAKTPEAIFMALSYCKSRNLDIFKKPVHIVPMWSSAKNQMVETVWPGISEIRTTATRTGSYAGISEAVFGEPITMTFEGDNKTSAKTVTFPEWCKITVYRFVRGQRCEYHAKVYWLEAYATLGKTSVPNDMWTKRAYGQLEKVTEAAALRKAFPEEIGNDYVAEEMEGHALIANDVSIPEVKKVAPPPPVIEQHVDEVDVDLATEHELDLASFCEELEVNLQAAKSSDDVEQIWADMDVECLCADNLDVVEKIKARRIVELEAA